jgi:chromatin assembly factor 1 subunit A
MPLFEMSPNILETEATGRKRSHEEYAGDTVMIENHAVAKGVSQTGMQPTRDTRKWLLTW